MRTKPWVMRLLIVLAVLALAPIAAWADVFTDITPGTAAPPPTLGGYTMTKFAKDPQATGYTPVASVASPLGGSVAFTGTAQHALTPSQWATWSHGYGIVAGTTGDVYYTGGATSLTMTLPAGTGAFYFYAEPNPFLVFTISAMGSDGVVSTTVSQSVDGLSGAKYFGIFTSGDKAISSIKVTSSADFAVGEFGIAKLKAPEPSSLALLALGTIGLAAWRRKKV